MRTLKWQVVTSARGMGWMTGQRKVQGVVSALPSPHGEQRTKGERITDARDIPQTPAEPAIG